MITKNMEIAITLCPVCTDHALINFNTSAAGTESSIPPLDLIMGFLQIKVDFCKSTFILVKVDKDLQSRLL